MPGIPPVSPVAPWHMWGSSQQIHLEYSVAGTVPKGSVQLARINYRRPDFWRFFLGARLLPGVAVAGPNDLALTVEWHLILGLGRTIYQTEPVPRPAAGIQSDYFGKFLFIVPAGFTPGSNNPNNYKWTTRVQSPPLDDNTLTSTEPCDGFPAQDIQCQASAAVVAGNVGNEVTVEVTAMFAPNVHIRPDWFSEAGGTIDGNEHTKYLGTERGGT